MPKSPKSAPPRSNLTLEQHWQIIQYKKEHPTLSTAEIARVFAEKFNHPTLNQSTVSRTLNKEERLRPFSNHTTRKKISQVRCPEVEEALMKWYSVEMEQGNVVTGPMLRSQAIKIADDMGIPEDQRPKYSNGWLDCYKSRHQLKFGNRPQSHSHSQRGSPAGSSVGSSAPTTGSTSLGSAHVQIQSRLAAQQQSLQQSQQSQVQVPPHLHRPITLATSSLSTTSLAPTPTQSLPTPHSPFYASPPLHMKSEPSEPDLDVDVDGEADVDADGDADEDLETDSDISGTSYPSRSPSCCSYGGYPAYAYPSYPSSYSTSHPHSHRHSHSYPSYTTSSNAYQCSACPPPHHLPPNPSSTSPTTSFPTNTTSSNHSISIPQQQEDEISRAVKSLKLHLESCPTLAPNRGNLLANMKVIECAVSDCRSSIGGDDEEEDAELERRMDVSVSGRVMGGVVIPHSRSQEPLSPLSPISIPISSTAIDSNSNSISRPYQQERTGGVSVPPRRQRWLDLVTSPTDSDYSNSHSHSNPGSVGGSPASTSMVQ